MTAQHWEPFVWKPGLLLCNNETKF